MVAPVDAAQKHRPDSSAFKQQKLKVWRPILTPKKVVMLFTGLGLIFLPIGIAIIVASNQVRPASAAALSVAAMVADAVLLPMLPLPFSACLLHMLARCRRRRHPPPSPLPLHRAACSLDGRAHALSRTRAPTLVAQVAVAETADYGRDASSNSTPRGGSGCCIANCNGNSWDRIELNPCYITLTIEETMTPPIFMYYQLANFYQNHRRYVRSRSDTQLVGDTTHLAADLKEDCMYHYSASWDGGAPINPCGLISWSWFNDTFALMRPDGTPVTLEQVSLVNCLLITSADCL